MVYRKKFFKLLIVLFIFFSFTKNSFAVNPSEFIQITVNEASSILGNNYSKEEKINKLKEIAQRTVDIKGIGYYSLGAYRKNISEDKKKEYLDIFEKYFLKSFASRLAEYTDPKIKVNSEKKLNQKYTMVSSVLIATDDKPEIRIDWRVNTKNPDNPLIIDLVIEGVSLAKVQKEEFNSIIQNNDNNIDALFLSLKEFSKE